MKYKTLYKVKVDFSATIDPTMPLTDEGNFNILADNIGQVDKYLSNFKGISKIISIEVIANYVYIIND